MDAGKSKFGWWKITVIAVVGVSGRTGVVADRAGVVAAGRTGVGSQVVAFGCQTGFEALSVAYLVLT